jgi:hypothetical protein
MPIKPFTTNYSFFFPNITLDLRKRIQLTLHITQNKVLITFILTQNKQKHAF